MANRKIVPQPYPRDKRGLLDSTRLQVHQREISSETLSRIVEEAIDYADAKASQDLFGTPHQKGKSAATASMRRQGRELLNYFRKYCVDPAQTALDCAGRHFEEIAKEQAFNRLVQKKRMNSGWRYQYIAKDTARQTGRFEAVSDIGGRESDFTAVISVNETSEYLAIYVSVKNRANTMGGQDWPKAIKALEQVAIDDRNRAGAYICVWGIAIERGDRIMKAVAGGNTPHSVNTEVWMADFFWPFFSGLTFDAIARSVLTVLKRRRSRTKTTRNLVPKEVLRGFGEACREYGIVDEKGLFSDELNLVDFLCGKVKRKSNRMTNRN